MGKSKKLVRQPGEMPKSQINMGFRQKVLNGGDIAADNMTAMLRGAPFDKTKARLSETFLREAVKVEHMNQLREQSNISNGIRIAHLLRDSKIREQYVEELRPAVRTRLLDAPEKITE